MTTDTLPRQSPKPPSLATICAVALETAIMMTFLANRSITGVCLCVLYFWFSATRAMLFDRYTD